MHVVLNLITNLQDFIFRFESNSFAGSRRPSHRVVLWPRGSRCALSSSAFTVTTTTPLHATPAAHFTRDLCRDVDTHKNGVNSLDIGSRVHVFPPMCLALIDFVSCSLFSVLVSVVSCVAQVHLVPVSSASLPLAHNGSRALVGVH